jgi:hypothetical protein
VAEKPKPKPKPPTQAYEWTTNTEYNGGGDDRGDEGAAESRIRSSTVNSYHGYSINDGTVLQQQPRNNAYDTGPSPTAAGLRNNSASFHSHRSISTEPDYDESNVQRPHFAAKFCAHGCDWIPRLVGVDSGKCLIQHHCLSGVTCLIDISLQRAPTLKAGSVKSHRSIATESAGASVGSAANSSAAAAAQYVARDAMGISSAMYHVAPTDDAHIPRPTITGGVR